MWRTAKDSNQIMRYSQRIYNGMSKCLIPSVKTKCMAPSTLCDLHFFRQNKIGFINFTCGMQYNTLYAFWSFEKCFFSNHFSCVSLIFLLDIILSVLFIALHYASQCPHQQYIHSK